MQVEISKDGERGLVRYDEQTHLVDVEFDGPKTAVMRHLTRKTVFRIPESQRIDDFREEEARPTESRTHMELALCTLYAETGFWVNWETLKD
jgi:hypothetical protein